MLLCSVHKSVVQRGSLLCSLSDIEIMMPLKLHNNNYFSSQCSIYYFPFQSWNSSCWHSYKKRNQVFTADAFKSCGFLRWLPSGMLHDITWDLKIAQHASTSVFLLRSHNTWAKRWAGHCWGIHNEWMNEDRRTNGQSEKREGQLETQTHNLPRPVSMSDWNCNLNLLQNAAWNQVLSDTMSHTHKRMWTHATLNPKKLGLRVKHQ